MHKKEGVKGCEESGPGSWTKCRFKPSQKPVEVCMCMYYVHTCMYYVPCTLYDVMYVHSTCTRYYVLVQGISTSTMYVHNI